MKRYNELDIYGAPTKKEKFMKFIRRVKNMKMGEKAKKIGEGAKKLYDKTIIPDKIKSYKEKKKFVRETKEEAMKEAREEMKDTMKEKYKKEELAKLTKTGSGLSMEKLAKGFDTGGKDEMSKKILDGFSMGGQPGQNDMSKKILDGFSMGGEQKQDDKIGDMMSTEGLASDDKLKRMLGQEEEPVEEEQTKKTKKKKQQTQQPVNKIENFEDKIKRLLE